MKDFEKHVKHTHADHEGKTWCGRPVGLEWAFENIDHAAYERMRDGRLLICDECLDAITTTLRL
jgi:hypothetical protein